jgi:putative copper export protein
LDRYELLKFIHVGAATVWVGGASVIQFVTDAAKHRQRLAAAPQSGQPAPRTGDLAKSPIWV